MKSLIDVVIVDDHPIVRLGISTLLSESGAFRVVAECSDASEAIEAAMHHRPDIILLDLNIPGSGLTAFKHIRQRAPEVRCVVLTMNTAADAALEALNHGACGYLLKGIGGSDLIAALRRIAGNESYVSPEFATVLLRKAQAMRTPNEGPNGDLTYREQQVVRELSVGASNREIAEKLGISEKTVKYHMTAIMQKLGVANRTGVVIAAQNRSHN